MTQAPASTVIPVILTMGFIPTTLFAPFYVPAKKGYYAAEGLEVSFRYGRQRELSTCVATFRSYGVRARFGAGEL